MSAEEINTVVLTSFFGDGLEHDFTYPLLIKSTRTAVQWSDLYWSAMRGDLYAGSDGVEKRMLVAKILKSLGSADHRDILVFSEHYYIDLSTKQPISDFK